MKIKSQLRNIAITAGLMLAAVGISLIIGGQGRIDGGTENTQMIFLLAVLLISRFTSGYFWGMLAAFISVPLVNYMFTYPYYVFNLTISGYLLTFVTMLSVSLIVSILTSRVQQQEHLRLVAEKEKLRANLLRAVSHDLRTPLTSIIGATGVILEQELPLQKQRELLADVNTDAQWLLRTMENILAITRFSGSASTLRTEAEVVEDVLASAVMKFYKHFSGVEVILEPSDDILMAEMDAVLIEQVITNLLENAVYHGVHTTQIRLTACRDGSFVRITVSDNGAGIPRERLQRLFQQYPGETQSADAKKHMGIGLSVCSSIIRAHGGTLTACNNQTGGASFAFTLPEKEIGHEYQNPDC